MTTGAVGSGLAVAEMTADQLDRGLAGVGVGSLLVEEGGPVGLGRLARPLEVRRCEDGVGALHQQPLGVVHQGVDHLVFGDHGDVPALDEQVALAAPGGDAEIGVAGLPGPLTTQPITATWSGISCSPKAAM